MYSDLEIGKWRQISLNLLHLTNYHASTLVPHKNAKIVTVVWKHQFILSVKYVHGQHNQSKSSIRPSWPSSLIPFTHDFCFCALHIRIDFFLTSVHVYILCISVYPQITLLLSNHGTHVPPWVFQPTASDSFPRLASFLSISYTFKYRPQPPSKIRNCMSSVVGF